MPSGRPDRLLSLVLAGALAGCGGDEAPSTGEVAPRGPTEAPHVITKFEVLLTASGESKIQTIKAVREVTGLGLAEAKALVESAPKVVRSGLSREEAERAARTLRDAGAMVEVR